MNYPSIRIEGGILSPDVFDRLDDAVGQQPVDFGFEPSAKVKDEIARAWADAQDYWRIFQRKLESLKAESPATTETRNNWIVPLLGLLGYQLEYQARGTELNGKNYPLSHRVTNRGQTPVHIIGCREPAGLDRKPEKSALRMSAHAMVQEYLNLTDQLFGVATNGRMLRLLRDSSRLVKLSYLEFDLDRIFADGLFADFAMLYRLLHASRLPQSAEVASSCWLERYHQDTIEQGTRIREGLRAAVTEALELLGTGFISDPSNNSLRQQIESKQLAAEDFFKYILRLVYRLLFVMVTEERGLVFPKGTPTKHINIYFQYYSVQRLRRLALTRGLKVERCHDAWLSLLSTFRLFEHPDTAAKLGMTALAGQLFHPDSLGMLSGCRLSNAALFSALDRLCNFTHPKSGQRMPVNFGALATEEFGSVYESLLELHPIVEAQPTPLFRFKQAAGNERKTTGSYYTPSSLVDCLLDSALDPVLDDRIRDFAKLGYKSAEAAILALKVCDPACGSGHFLIAAAQRIARRLARVRSGDDEPSPQVMRHALREVIGHCIYGVDINPMSVELCKVALWMEAMEPGKPLSFLDHHIQCGNSLLGTTPALMVKGIPDDAFTAIEGDAKARSTELKKQNKKERQDFASRQGYLFEPPMKLGNIAADFAKLGLAPDETVDDVAAMQTRYAELVRESSYQFGRLLADAWCAAFVWKKDDSDLGKMCPTERDFRKVESQAAAGLLPHVRKEVEHLRDQFQFFHWHLAFPDVFRLPGKDVTPENEQTGWSGGFDAMLGNPPWDRLKFNEQEWFAERAPEIANAPTTAARKKLLDALSEKSPALFRKFMDERRAFEGINAIIRNSGNFPHGSGGELNLATLFAECSTRLASVIGRVGIVLPTTIITDKSAQPLCQSWLENGRLVAVFDFENRAGLFPHVHRSYKFSVITLRGGREPGATVLAAFFLEDPAEASRDENLLRITVNDIAKVNPNTLSFPVSRTKRDAELLLAIHAKSEPLLRDKEEREGGSWGYGVFFVFEMNKDSGSFSTEASGDMLPLLEAKLVHQFAHRAATFAGQTPRDLANGNARESTPGELANAEYSVLPRFWVPASEVDSAFKRGQLTSSWAVVAREITNATNERTVLTCIIPKVGMGHTAWTLRLSKANAPLAGMLVANLNSLSLDYAARQKVGGTHLSNFILKQLPVFPPATYAKPSPWAGQHPSAITYQQFLLPRVLELTYTAWDLEPFALDCGYTGPPFRWDDERRFLLRAELDAAFFHLYGINCDDAAYILDTFPIVRRKDEEKYNGEHRTKTTILEIYDALSESTRTGRPYKTLLAPPPGPPAADLPKWQAGEPMPADWPPHIHPPRETTPMPLRPAAIAPQAFPATPRDRWLVAAFLDMVTAQPGLRCEDYHSALRLAAAQDTCARLLADTKDKRAFKRCLKQLPPTMVAQKPTTVPWDSIWTFVQLHQVVEVEHDAVRVGDGSSLQALQAKMGPSASNYISLVLKAASRLRDLTPDDSEAATVLEELQQS